MFSSLMALVLGVANIFAPQSTMNPTVLQLASNGYHHAIQNHLTHSPLMIIIDYSKPSTKKRLWLLNMDTHQIILNGYVAHGAGSGHNLAQHFSNTPRSKMSSLGFFLTGTQYVGRHGRSIHLHGLEPHLNSLALQRGIVIHAASYVSEDTIAVLHRLGRSWGCFAINRQALPVILSNTKTPTLIMSYYPNKAWIEHSNFLI